jgi:hypothetical protein
MRNNKVHINEATGDSLGGRGSYIAPLVPGMREFKKEILAPYTDSVSSYESPLLAYDSYDGKMDERRKQIKKIEAQARKITDYIKKHPNSTNSDEDGNIINPTPGKNKKFVPMNEWIEITDDLLKEDLAVWFGTKKKPKGSKQPKGPWVNICSRDKNGKHPPCGRSEATDKAYPKCRAAGVAGKMSDSEKRAACQQKRKAEKTHSKVGTGNKPKMVSYKPRKSSKNEGIDLLVKKLVNEIIKKQS